MTTRVTDLFLFGDHASRPAETGVPVGGLYACSTHAKIYKNVAGTWTDWGTLTASTSATRTVNAQTGTTYTLVLSDANNLAFLTMSNASASTLTVPPNSSVAFPVGSVIEGAQVGAGQVTLTAGAGVTLNATPGLKVAAQYGTFGLIKTATNTWLAYGRLST